MIVRNEASIIARCLASITPAIDWYVIVDTGSTDDTVERAEKILRDRGIDGEIHRTEFVDFDTTRNEALDLCRRSSAAFDYILLADADMELRVDDPSFRERLVAPAYRLVQRSSISYQNVRLIRRDLDARYVGATHEYLDTGVQAEKIDELWFIDHQDGSSRSEKWERDRRLLSRALERSPNDARSMFYLAQTLRESGRLAEASRWYEARIAAGGWDEEVWYSKWMLAFTSAKDDDDFVRLCFEAYRFRPGRAEPLHSIARRLREACRWERAMSFAEKGRAIPFPSHDLLFIDDSIYREGFDEETSIAGYYCKSPVRYAAGRDACFSLATRRSARSETRLGARFNSVYYARRFDEVFPGSSSHPITMEVGPGWSATNPSIARTADGWRGVVRTVNYRLVDGNYVNDSPGAPIRTRNWLVRFSDAFEIESALEIEEPADAPRCADAPIRGYEDCRLIVWREALWCSATVADRSPDMRREVILLRLDADGSVAAEYRLRGLVAGRNEKNWVPFVFGDELLFVYQADPTTVVRFDPDSGRVAELVRQTPDLALEQLRGGSQAVAVDGGWLYLTHEVDQFSPRVYLHRFAYLTDDFRVGAVSDPFYFSRKGIEFAAGLARDGSRLVASYGVNDGEAHIAEFDLDQVLTIMGVGADRSAEVGKPSGARPRAARERRLTLVTACFDLASRERDRQRGIDFYRSHGSWLLGLDHDLVIYTEPGLVEELRGRRKEAGLESRTLVVASPLERFASFRQLDEIRLARQENPIRNANPRKDTPLYAALGWAKFEMLRDAISSNPFSTSHVGWIDLGLAHVATRTHTAEDRVFDEPSDRMRILVMRPFDRRDFGDRRTSFEFLRGYVAAGYLAGSRAVVDEVCEVIAREARDCLDERFAPSDEQLLPLVAVQRPDLFELTFGDYPSILVNHSVMRSAADNLLFQLRSSRERGMFDRGAEIARRIMESLRLGTFAAPPEPLADLLEESFISAWYAERPLTDLAETIAREYVRRVGVDAAFRSAFESNEARVRANFAWLDHDVWSVAGGAPAVSEESPRS